MVNTLNQVPEAVDAAQEVPRGFNVPRRFSTTVAAATLVIASGCATSIPQQSQEEPPSQSSELPPQEESDNLQRLMSQFETEDPSPEQRRLERRIYILATSRSIYYHWNDFLLALQGTSNTLADIGQTCDVYRESAPDPDSFKRKCTNLIFERDEFHVARKICNGIPGNNLCVNLSKEFALNKEYTMSGKDNRWFKLSELYQDLISSIAAVLARLKPL